MEIWSLLSARLQILKQQMTKHCQITLSCSITDKDLRNGMQIVVFCRALHCVMDLAGQNFGHGCSIQESRLAVLHVNVNTL